VVLFHNLHGRIRDCGDEDLRVQEAGKMKHVKHAEPTIAWDVEFRPNKFSDGRIENPDIEAEGHVQFQT
jgi:hypothetical protein